MVILQEREENRYSVVHCEVALFGYQGGLVRTVLSCRGSPQKFWGTLQEDGIFSKNKEVVVCGRVDNAN